jgi:tetraacyldisaccharide 4'-kinase
MLPRGPLREPVGALRRADAVVVTRSAGAVPPVLAAALQRHNPRARVMHCRFESDRFLGPGGEAVDAAILGGFSAFVFSGIARPDRFEDDVRALGLRIAGTRRFADHHRYRDSDLAAIGAAARAAGAAILATTEKDLVRIADPSPAGLPIHALRMRVVFAPGADPRDWILGRLAAATGGAARATGAAGDRRR